MINEKVSEIESQAEKEATNADLDDELDDDLNNFGNVFQEVQFIHALFHPKQLRVYSRLAKRAKAALSRKRPKRGEEKTRSLLTSRRRLRQRRTTSQR